MLLIVKKSGIYTGRIELKKGYYQDCEYAIKDGKVYVKNSIETYSNPFSTKDIVYKDLKFVRKLDQDDLLEDVNY